MKMNNLRERVYNKELQMKMGKKKLQWEDLLEKQGEERVQRKYMVKTKSHFRCSRTLDSSNFLKFIHT